MRIYKRCDLTGRLFGQLTVIKEVPGVRMAVGRPVRRWLVRCDCGNLKEIDQLHLTRNKGSSRSCGCVSLRKKFPTKNTIYYRRLYHVWLQMVKRCHQPKNASYQKYGARGIKVCSSWRAYSQFYNDMIDTYAPGLTIERIDVNGNYEPSNCTWIPNENQAKNRRTTRWVNGMCAKDACKLAGVNYATFLLRLKRGQTIEQAFH